LSVPNESEPDLTLFLDILRKLESLEIPYIIIGGFAAAMYGITRVTFDIDIIVKMEESGLTSWRSLRLTSQSWRPALRTGARTCCAAI
jgi:hypothetical protein